MRKEDHRVDSQLAKISHEFSLHRRGKKKSKSYPRRLRALAMTGVAAGIPGLRVAKAAGISAQSLGNWRKEHAASTTSPRELVVVDQEESLTAASNLSANHPVSIRFRSGIRMELSPMALTAELISRFNEVRR